MEEAAQRLYKEWFVDLRFPGYENTPIVDGVPQGWKNGSLGDIALFKRGKTITKDQTSVGEIPVVAGGLEPAYYHNQSNTSSPVITVSGSGANAGFTRMHHTNIWASDCSFVDKQSTSYIYFTFCVLKNKKSDIDILQKGAAQPHVYAKDINALEIIIPEADILARFENTVSPYFEKVKSLLVQIELSKQARDRLLPKLMNGEIDPSDSNQAKILQHSPSLSYDEFLSELGLAARAKSISDADLKAMYEAYLDDDATE